MNIPLESFFQDSFVLLRYSVEGTRSGSEQRPLAVVLEDGWVVFQTKHGRAMRRGRTPREGRFGEVEKRSEVVIGARWDRRKGAGKSRDGVKLKAFHSLSNGKCRQLGLRTSQDSSLTWWVNEWPLREDVQIETGNDELSNEREQKYMYIYNQRKYSLKNLDKIGHPRLQTGFCFERRI